MAGIIAVQAITTAEAAEQTKKQAELMNKSLIEMKKERMNIEYMKNEVIGYIKKLEDMLNDALHNEVPIYYELPQYSNLTPETPETPGWAKSYQERGLEERLKRKIKRLLKEYDINLEKYNSLVTDTNRLRREVIDALKGEFKLVESLQRISQEEAERFYIKEAHIIKADTLLEELVTLSNTETRESNQLSAPPYGRLGLNTEQKRLYGLEVWNKAKKVFYEFLLEKKPEIYNKLVEREKKLKELKTLTRELLEKIKRIEDELFQDEEKLEKKLLEL